MTHLCRGTSGHGWARRWSAFFAPRVSRISCSAPARNSISAIPGAVRAFYEKFRPTYVIVAAAKVGGIWANASQPVEFLSDNLQIELNLINGAHAVGVKKLLFLGSSCIYPKLAPQPLTEESLLTGSLEPTNEAYALAKICGIKLCQAYAKQYGANFISAMPTNLYGPDDNFDLQTSHVLPALLHKFHLAKEQGQPSVTLWGHRQRLPRIPARRRPRAGLLLPHAELRFAGAAQRRLRGGHHHPRPRRIGRPGRRLHRFALSGTPPSPTAPPANCSMSPS